MEDNKEFIPYEQALALKELGFDEEVFGYYGHYGANDSFLTIIGKEKRYTRKIIKAPLYQQAFRWFREKYNLHSIFEHDSDNYYYVIQGINDLNLGIDSSEDGDVYQSCEEAELECLKKLIEIVKSKS